MSQQQPLTSFFSGLRKPQERDQLAKRSLPVLAASEASASKKLKAQDVENNVDDEQKAVVSGRSSHSKRFYPFQPEWLDPESEKFVP
jgi:hypothetical protein